jgi:hypothetical protein
VRTAADGLDMGLLLPGTSKLLETAIIHVMHISLRRYAPNATGFPEWGSLLWTGDSSVGFSDNDATRSAPEMISHRQSERSWEPDYGAPYPPPLHESAYVMDCMLASTACYLHLVRDKSSAFGIVHK